MKKIVLMSLVVICFALFFYFDLSQYTTLEYVKANQELFQSYYLENQLQTIIIFFSIYILTTALSIPGATILTLLGGALFGLPLGLLIISFASTIGATLAFLLARTIFKDSLEKKYSQKLKTINKGVEKDGAFYLFTLRLVPVFPFFLINILMGLTNMKTFVFFIVSQVGMFAGTVVYVNAGVQLSQIDSLKGILSFDLLMAFAALGFLPIISKKIIHLFKAKKVYRRFKKPKNFDYNMIVIGGGAAGLVTSYISAAVKAKVLLVEKHKMGGDCLNTGCVPSKALIKGAKVAHTIAKSSEFGIQASIDRIDFKEVMRRVHKTIKQIEPHDSVERYTNLGVDCLSASATIISPWEVEVDGKIYTTKNITIATGASPFVPSIPGIDKSDILTSENLWELDELPQRLVILGAGPIGLEMAQSFNRLGSKVTVIELNDSIMNKEDKDVSKLVYDRLINEGVDFKLNSQVTKFDANTLSISHNGMEQVLEFDKCLVAIGRKANVKGFGLEKLGLDLNENSTINVNEFMQTKFPNIFACGDVAGPYQLTHMAAHQAWYCAVNGLFGILKKFKVDYSTVPWVTYTDPEVAFVGKNEKQLLEEGIDYDIVKYDISDLDRAITDGEDYGLVKVLTAKGSDKILGAYIVGQNAGELITEFVTTMKHNKGLNDILGTIHSYPTMSEANKYSAGVWKKMNAPEKLLSYVEKFHTWRR